MSKSLFHLSAAFHDTNFTAPVDGLVKHTFNANLEKDSPYEVGNSWTMASSTTLDLNDAEVLDCMELRMLVVQVVKTGTTVSGTCSITCAAAGISTGTLSPQDNDSRPLGTILKTFAYYADPGTLPGAGADVTVVMTSPVGFQIRVLASGAVND